MALSRLTNNKEKVVAVADIGSGSAGCAILAVHLTGPASVVAAERAMLPIEKRTSEAAVAGIAGKLVEAGEKVLKAYTARARGNVRIDNVYAVIRAPWTRSQTARAETRFDAEVPVTGEIIAGLAKKTFAQVSSLTPSRFLEASVMQVELNGYPTEKPEGKRAHEVGVTALISDCVPAARVAAESSLEKLFPHVPVTFRSGARAILSVLHGNSSEKNYVVLDMASEGTSILVVREGVAGGQALIPEGVRDILSRVAQSGMPEETLSLLRMLSRDQCESDACKTVEASLARVEPELVRIFGEAMGELGALRRLPNHLILVTHPDVAPWLTRFFSRIDFTQFTQTAQPFSVVALAPRDLAAWVSPEAGVQLDCGLAVAGSLVNIETRTS